MPLLILLAILAVIAIVCIFHQLTRGFAKTNLNDQYSWGLYIQGFFFLVSVGAGALMVLAMLTLAQAALPAGFADFGNVLAFTLLIGGMVILGLDLGKPFRIFYMVTSKNFKSPLIWDFYTLGLTVLLSFLFLFPFLSGSAVGSQVWALLMLLAAGLCVTVHAMFFPAHEKGGNQANLFLVFDTFLFSLSGGCALLTLMGAYLGLSLPLLSRCLFLLSILLVISAAGHKIAPLRSHSDTLLTVCNLLKVLVVVLLAVWQWAVPADALAVAASVLAVLLLFLEKYHTVAHAQREPMIPGTYGRHRPVVSYRPSAKEWLIFIGGMSICLLLWAGICLLKGIWPWML
jgi:Ni/Fe-hydrogenase subunit HybB-like protein